MSANILIVDDEPCVLRALKRLLRSEPYDVYSASNGSEGLAVLSRRQIDLVISDMRMPEMSGTEFLVAARNQQPGALRMVLTGYSDMQSTIKAINDGRIFGYLTKPWEGEQLKELIQTALRHHFRQKEKVAAISSALRERQKLKTLLSKRNNLQDVPQQSTQVSAGPAIEHVEQFSDLLHNVFRQIGKRPADKPLQDHIFTVAMAYTKYRVGLITGTIQSHDRAVAYLRYNKELYGDEIINAVSSIRIGADGFQDTPDRQLPVMDLRNGMALNRDVLSNAGTLLLRKGTVLDNGTIFKLQQMQRNCKDPILVGIRLQSHDKAVCFPAV